MNMNVVHFGGRLVNDPELQHTQGNVPYCRFRLAINRKTKGSETDFFNIIAWNKLAEFVSKYFKKGDRIIVHGEARNSDYIDQKGIKHYGMEIQASQLEFVDTKASKGTDMPEPTPPYGNPTNVPEEQAFSDTPF